MEEKQLKGNLIEVARSLHAKFNVENANDTTRECDQPHEILMIRSKRERQEEYDGADSLTKSMQGLTFLAKHPQSASWRRDEPLINQGPIRDITIHRVYIDTGSSTDIIYENCFCLLPDRWKESLKPTTRWPTGFIGHDLWPLSTIRLWFTMTIYDKEKNKRTLIDFL